MFGNIKKCKIENCNSSIWSNGLCKNHASRKPMKKSRLPISPTIEKNYNETTKEMHLFFLSIWNKRPHKSEISGEMLFSPPASSYFHHILSKEKFPELKYCEDNIIMLSLQEHGDVEGNMFRYPEINKRREILKEKYNL